MNLFAQSVHRLPAVVCLQHRRLRLPWLVFTTNIAHFGPVYVNCNHVCFHSLSKCSGIDCNFFVGISKCKDLARRSVVKSTTIRSSLYSSHYQAEPAVPRRKKAIQEHQNSRKVPPYSVINLSDGRLHLLATQMKTPG